VGWQLGVYNCNKIYKRGLSDKPEWSTDYPRLYEELRWLREKCKTYPTIDTFAKKLAVTKKYPELYRLKNVLSVFFSLIQSHEKRDLRYDGLVASIINDDETLPDTISILSWNYDSQLEYVLRDFSSRKSNLSTIWKEKSITCKGFEPNIDYSHFNCVKLNGTAIFSSIRGDLLELNDNDLKTIEEWCSTDFESVKSNISFAWEKDEQFIDNILPLVKDARTLIVIGYSFPYVNRAVDKRLIQSMTMLQNVYIQDKAALDVKQSFETLLSPFQQTQIIQRSLKIHPRTSVAQFIIPNELS